jgi:hypothetical protein
MHPRRNSKSLAWLVISLCLAGCGNEVSKTPVATPQKESVTLSAVAAPGASDDAAGLASLTSDDLRRVYDSLNSEGEDSSNKVNAQSAKIKELKPRLRDDNRQNVVSTAREILAASDIRMAEIRRQLPLVRRLIAILEIVVKDPSKAWEGLAPPDAQQNLADLKEFFPKASEDIAKEETNLAKMRSAFSDMVSEASNIQPSVASAEAETNSYIRDQDRAKSLLGQCDKAGGNSAADCSAGMQLWQSTSDRLNRDIQSTQQQRQLDQQRVQQEEIWREQVRRKP